MRVTYFTNQYPKVSHSFICRKILALERQGVEVVRACSEGGAFRSRCMARTSSTSPLGLHLREKIEATVRVVAISSYGRSQSYRWVDHDHWPKIEVVHCGLEASFLDTPALEALPYDQRLVCVGRPCEQKDQLLLLDAIRLLRDQGERVHLVLAGDGEMRTELERFVQHHGLQVMVSITGWISNDRMRQELLSAKAMVLATPTERLRGMGMTARARVVERHAIDTEAAKLRHLFQSLQ